MRRSAGPWSVAAAAAGVAAGLVFTLSGPAHAWRGDLETEPLHDARQAGERRQSPAAIREIPAEKAAQCGKCHTSCEEGRIHEGLPRTSLPAGLALPMGEDGRATCSTCHAPHGRDEVPGSALLRVPNLRRELCLACHAGESDDTLRIRVVSPPDRSIVPESRLALIAKLSGPAEKTLAVRLNGAEFQLPVRGDAVFTWLSLQEGVNRIEILEGARALWTGEVFRGENAPRGYGRKTVGHCTDSREECLGCHDAKGEKIADAAVDPSRLCYGCHDRFEGKRYLHGPLAVGACLACHDPHRGYGAAHLREEPTLLCANCHAARETAAVAACQVSGKSCADCHDPHQSDARYLLKGPKYTMGGPAPAGR